MEKVLQILAVFGLLMLLIWRSMRTREERFRRFSYLGRVRAPLTEHIERWTEAPNDGRELYGVPPDADAWLWCEERQWVMWYSREGKLTISRRLAGGRNKELQEISVPMDCTGLGWDPLERKIYLEENGDWFVYGEEDN